MTQLVWLKRDLRVRDHAPLVRASAAGPTLCLYIFEPELLTAPDCDSAHVQFVLESLAELKEDLDALSQEQSKDSLLLLCGAFGLTVRN